MAPHSQLEERLAAAARWTDSGAVFASRVGKRIEPSDFTRSFKATLKRLDLPDIRLHDLRHSCASLLLATQRSVKAGTRTSGCCVGRTMARGESLDTSGTRTQFWRRLRR